MEQYLLYLVVDIFSQQHQSDNLKWRELLEVIPFYIDIQKIRFFLFLLCIGSNLFDSPVNQVFGMPVYSSVVFTGHHLIVTWHPTVALFLVFYEFLAKKLE